MGQHAAQLKNGKVAHSGVGPNRELQRDVAILVIEDPSFLGNMRLAH